MYFMKLQYFKSCHSWSLFDAQNKVTTKGQEQFWEEIGTELRRFEIREIELKPIITTHSITTKKKHAHHSKTNRCY